MQNVTAPNTVGHLKGNNMFGFRGGLKKNTKNNNHFEFRAVFSSFNRDLYVERTSTFYDERQMQELRLVSKERKKR
jgi:hypothetical protein